MQEYPLWFNRQKVVKEKKKVTIILICHYCECVYVCCVECYY